MSWFTPALGVRGYLPGRLGPRSGPRRRPCGRRSCPPRGGSALAQAVPVVGVQVKVRLAAVLDAGDRPERQRHPLVQVVEHQVARRGRTWQRATTAARMLRPTSGPHSAPAQVPASAARAGRERVRRRRPRCAAPNGIRTGRQGEVNRIRTSPGCRSRDRPAVTFDDAFADAPAPDPCPVDRRPVGAMEVVEDALVLPLRDADAVVVDVSP